MASKETLIKCSKCGKETPHSDFGVDMPKHRRFTCEVCDTTNRPPEPEEEVVTV